MKRILLTLIAAACLLVATVVAMPAVPQGGIDPIPERSKFKSDAAFFGAKYDHLGNLLERTDPADPSSLRAALAQFAALCVPADPTIDFSESASLKVEDYKHLDVGVSGFNESGKAAREKVMTRLELRLRQAGIDPKTPRNQGVTNELTLKILAYDSNGFVLITEFKAPAVLMFAPSGSVTSEHPRIIYPAVWTSGVAQKYDSRDPAVAINQAADAELDKFLNAYLKANQ